ncbi:MAG: hypothetical protein IJF53_01130, partial [Clostridia bacterium]|nr:hypothetical protein [Clostridia bacterium]
GEKYRKYFNFCENILDKTKMLVYYAFKIKNAKALTKRVARPEKAQRASGWCKEARVGGGEVHFRAAVRKAYAE